MTDRRTIDRRTFLGLIGLSGASLAAMTVTSPAARAATTDAISLGNQINSLVVGVHGADWSWENSCQMAQYYAEWAVRGSESGIQAYGSAHAAYVASSIVSTDMASAPPGSFSYWAFPTYGHVATNLGNGYCLNTSGHAGFSTLYDLGHGLRITPLTGYPYAYQGWSYSNGVNAQLPVSAWSPGSGGAGWAWNAPDADTQRRIQQALTNRGRYGGPIDGVWGPNSIKGIQTTCANVGYTGPIDGVPGPNTCHYVQVYAQRFGSYTGPVDSVLGPYSWNGFALGLERP